MNQSTIILKNEQESHMLRTVRHRSPRADEGKENGPAIHNTHKFLSLLIGPNSITLMT